MVSERGNKVTKQSENNTIRLRLTARTEIDARGPNGRKRAEAEAEDLKKKIEASTGWEWNLRTRLTKSFARKKPGEHA